MKIVRTTEMCHPILTSCIEQIKREIIEPHRIPMRVFETGRIHDRHEMLIQRGKTKNVFSRHLHNLDNDPPLYTTAVDFVYYDGKWSWNLRDSTINAWYDLFGNLVLDLCPELEWAGQNRKSKNYCHFQVRHDILLDKLENVPCVIP
jgi:hypothetical protein